MAFVRVTSSDALRSGEMAGLVVGGRKLLLVCLDGCFHAYSDRCAHLGLPLSRGSLDGSTLTCSAHHYQYDATTGRGINPVSVRLKSYPLKIEAGAVWVELDAEGTHP
jgi:toluene monooxygenase system ferredoxin subunit